MLELYIYGTNRSAWQLFIQCCSLRISIKGFVDDNREIETFFHKRVYRINELDKDINVLLVSENIAENVSYEGKKIFCNNILDLTISNKDKKKIVIYGAGVCGRLLLKHLRENDFNVESFIQTEITGEQVIDGIPVQSVNIVKELTEDTVVICAGKYYEQMYETVQKYTENMDCYYVTLGDLYICRDKQSIVFNRREGRKRTCISIASNIEEFFESKSIWLYGGEYQNMCDDKAIYNLLGYSDITIATDDEMKDTKNVVDFLYEDNAVIFLYDPRRIKRLEALGLIEGKDYVSAVIPGPKNIVKDYYDINIGQAYTAFGRTDGVCVCPGIYRYGENNKTNYTIMILGGSTSDEAREWWKSWPYLFYKKVQEINQNVTIYNCASSGYNSAQELLRYLRDGAIIQPDLVISYTGVNDLTRMGSAGYNISALRYAGEFYTNHCTQELTTGLQDERDLFDVWLDNLKCIKALTSARGAQYIAFAQPAFFMKKEYMTKHEKKLAMMINAIYSDEEKKAEKQFREKCRGIRDEFIVNLTDIFDNEDVYYDVCHTYEKGNHIIAAKIYEEIVRREYLK